MDPTAGKQGSQSLGQETAVSPLRTRLLNWLIAAAAIPAILSVAALAGRWSWLLDLTTHFRVHYLVALTIAAFLCGILCKYRLAVVFAAFAIVNATIVAPLYFGPTTKIAGTSSIRVISVNAHCANRDRSLLPEYIRAESPDLVLVLEVDGGWAERLEAMSDTFPHHIIAPRREDCFGIALLSKLPFADQSVREIGPAGVPSIVAKIELPSGEFLNVIGSHPLPPVTATYSEMRNQQLDALAQIAQRLDRTTILLGDFNITSWSPHFHHLLDQSGLLDSRRGFGNQPTWPSRIAPLGIAIDHVLHSPDVVVAARRVGPDVGSDHRPVVVELAISPLED